ncbi:MAG: hypothetical protein GVY19_03005 [Bacteroidetes bacterium]|jgi:uncharacterized protein YkwD|nr:hypothetical protein [Bacteroidota bacterium]
MRDFFITGLIIFTILSCEDKSEVTDSGYSNFEVNILNEVNTYRNDQSLATVEMNDIMWEQARIHSQMMANGQKDPGTDNINERYQVIRNQIDSIANLQTVVAFRINESTDLLNYWLSFPSFSKIVKGDFNYTGIGVAENNDGVKYTTQIFAKIILEEE